MNFDMKPVGTIVKAIISPQIAQNSLQSVQLHYERAPYKR